MTCCSLRVITCSSIYTCQLSCGSIPGCRSFDWSEKNQFCTLRSAASDEKNPLTESSDSTHVDMIEIQPNPAFLTVNQETEYTIGFRYKYFLNKGSSNHGRNILDTIFDHVTAFQPDLNRDGLFYVHLPDAGNGVMQGLYKAEQTGNFTLYLICDDVCNLYMRRSKRYIIEPQDGDLILQATCCNFLQDLKDKFKKGSIYFEKGEIISFAVTWYNSYKYGSGGINAILPDGSKQQPLRNFVFPDAILV